METELDCLLDRYKNFIEKFHEIIKSKSSLMLDEIWIKF